MHIFLGVIREIGDVVKFSWRATKVVGNMRSAVESEKRHRFETVDRATQNIAGKLQLTPEYRYYYTTTLRHISC